MWKLLASAWPEGSWEEGRPQRLRSCLKQEWTYTDLEPFGIARNGQQTSKRTL